MKDTSNACLSRMGELNNALVKVLNASSASPAEAIVVLRQITARIERHFELVANAEGAI